MDYVDIYKYNSKKDAAVSMLPVSLRITATTIQNDFDTELSLSKTDYDRITQSIDKAEYIGQSDPLIFMYMCFKVESKILLKVLESYNLKQLKLHKEMYMNHSKGKTAALSIKFSEASSHYHQMLRESVLSIKSTFHQNFDVDFHSMTDYRKKLVYIRNILALKDDLLSKLCASLRKYIKRDSLG
jgi:hypothetical protein